MKSFVYLILSATLVLGLFTGCSKDNANQANVTSGTTNAIEHTKGNVEVPVEVKKAVVFDYGILDIIDALEVEVEIAAPVSSLPAYLDHYANAVGVGSVKEPDLEAIFEFEPDVIFIGGRQQDYYDQLSEIAPTIYVQLNGDTYIDDFKANVGYVAKIFDKENETRDAINAIDELIAEARELTDQSDDKAMVLLTNDGSISVYGIGSRFGIVHDVLGAKAADENVEVSTHGQSVNFEYIADKNPDLIFVIDRTVVVGGTNTAASILDNDLVNNTNAALNNKIISLDPNIWYLSGGGITSINKMITDVKNAY